MIGKNRIVRIVIICALVCLAVFLAFKVYKSVDKYVDYNTERDMRHDELVENMELIKATQIAYKSINGEYATDFEVLNDFIVNGYLNKTKKVLDPNMPDSLTEKSDVSLIELGYLMVDTVRIPVIDTLFDEGYDVSLLRYIPYSDFNGGEREEFIMKTRSNFDSITSVRTAFIVVKAATASYLKGLDEHRISIETYDTIRFGSLFETTLEGNWETINSDN